MSLFFAKWLHLYALFQCRALQKQFLHISNAKNKMMETLQDVTAANNQLKVTH